MITTNIVFIIALTILFYAHVLYPLVNIIVSLSRTKCSILPDDDLPSVSLIIPAYNEERVIAAKLQNALNINYPHDLLEIIVASDGSTDSTVELASAFQTQRVKILELDPKGKPSAINSAVAQSRGEVLCLCDANVLFHPDALRNMVRHFSDPQIGAVSGQVQLASEQSDFEAGETTYYRFERLIYQGESILGSMIGVDGGMYVMRRELFVNLPPHTPVDDFINAMRVLRQGKRVIYEPSAIAWENGTPSWKDEFRRRVRITKGALQSISYRAYPPISRPIELWQYISHKMLRWMGPFWLLLLLISNAGVWHRGLFYQSAMLAQLGFYGLATAAWLSPWLRQLRPAGIAFYFTMSHVAMLLGWWQALVSRPSGRWARTPRTVLEKAGDQPSPSPCPGS